MIYILSPLLPTPKNNVQKYFKKINIRMKNKIFEVSNTKSMVINETYILESRIWSVTSQVQKAQKIFARQEYQSTI